MQLRKLSVRDSLAVAASSSNPTRVLLLKAYLKLLSAQRDVCINSYSRSERFEVLNQVAVGGYAAPSMLYRGSY